MRGIIDKMHLKHALLDRWSTEGRDVSGEEKETVGGRQIPLLRGRVLWPCWSYAYRLLIVVVVVESRLYAYKYMGIGLARRGQEIGNRGLTIWLTIN